METIGGEGWEINLLPGWIASEDGEFLTLVKSEDGGAITLSALIDESEDISLDELQIYGKSKIPDGAKLKPVAIGSFNGFTSEFEDEEGIFWHHSWLALHDLLVYFSYNGMPEAWESEKSDVLKILKSLANKEDE